MPTCARPSLSGFTLAVCLALLLFPSLALAQQPPASSSSPSPAETLFDDGLRDMRAAHYDTGCPRLAESYRLDPLPGALFTLADCEAAWGKTATALGHYQSFVQLLTTLPPARRDRFTERRGIALAKMAALAGIVPELTIDVAPGAPAGLVVKRNGVALDRAAYGVGRKVDPGEYSVTAELDGHATWERVVHLGERDRAHVEVPALAVSPAPTDTPAPGPAAPVASPSSRPPWLLVSAAVGAAGLVTGIVAGSMALSDKSTIDADCPNHTCTPAGRSAVGAGQSAALVSTIGFVVGLAGGATAGVLWLTSPHATHATAVGFDRGAGLGFTGAF
jgi:hypothetical protein